MDKSFILVIVMTCVGLYSIFCSIMNFDWFIQSKRAWIFLKLFGRTGVRIFYIVVGLLLIYCAIMAYRTGQI